MERRLISTDGMILAREAVSSKGNQRFLRQVGARDNSLTGLYERNSFYLRQLKLILRKGYFSHETES